MKANNAEISGKTGVADSIKWVVTFVLLAAAVIGNYLYSDWSVVTRAIAVVVLIAAALGIAAITTKGKLAIAFAREARTEIRKVVWPTRQETMQTTFIVLAVSVVVALALWGIDGIMVRLVSFVTSI